MNLFAELKRRNVFKVAAAYLIVAWLIMQAGDTLSPALRLPDWVNSALAFFLILGFPLALFFAWVFELTPEGLRKETEIDRSQSITGATGQRLNVAIIILMAASLSYFVWDKFVGSESQPGSNASEIAESNGVSVEKYPDVTPGFPSIAVLPFVNMSSDKEQEYFSDGLSEELLNLLAKIPELRVAARTSSFSFKGQSLEIPEIAARLNVAHVLEGSVRKSGKQIRITAQLVRADKGYHLWSETYDRQLDNIFQIQEEIAVAVVDALKITLLGNAPKVRETDPEAYQLFLEGQFFRRQVSEPSILQAIDLYKKALVIDPAYVPAWAELAYTYIWFSGIGGMSIETANTLADQAIETALNLDPNYGWAYFVRGASNVFNKFNFKAGIEDYQNALRLDPGNAFLIAATGNGARVTGRFDEAIRQYSSALELDPIMPEIHIFQGLAYLSSGSLENAEQSFRTALSLSPLISGGHYRLGRALLRKGDLEAALAEMQSESTLVYRDTGLAMVQHSLGQNAESDAALEELITQAASDAAFQVAEIHAYRGEADQAFSWLEKSLLNRDSGLASLLGDMPFLNLLTDPRWQPFLEKLGLLDFWLEMPPEWGGPIE